MRTLLFLNLFLLVACSNKTPLDNPIYKTAIKFSEEKTWLYDPNYYKIAYPNGDVPTGGACTDVIIRVLRENGMDLQELIHEDMLAHFDEYPHKWGLVGFPFLVQYKSRIFYHYNSISSTCWA